MFNPNALRTARALAVLSAKGLKSFVFFQLQDELMRAYIADYHLNEDQAEAIKRVGSMFSVEKSDSVDSVLLIHGKSYFCAISRVHYCTRCTFNL